MKKLFFLTLVLSVSFSFAQSKNKTTADSFPVNGSQAVINDDKAIYNTAGIEVKPEFPGGPTKMYEFIEKNFVKPEGEIIKGKIYVTAIVEKDGTLTDIKVLRDLGHGTGKEAIRVLKKMPKWSSGEQNGVKVRCTYSFPITFL